MSDEQKEKELVGEEELSLEVKELLEPSQTALLLIDIQHGYCASDGNLAKEILSGTDQIQKMVPKLKEFSDFARSLGMPIIWTRMIEDPTLSSKTVQMKMKVSGHGALTTPGTPGFEYFQISPQEGDLEIVKKNYDAFTEEELLKILKEKGITSLVITGANTGVCVESTIRSAQANDYFVFVPKDLVGEPDKMTERGEDTLVQIDQLFGWVTKSDTIREVWSDALKPKIEKEEEA